MLNPEQYQELIRAGAAFACQIYLMKPDMWTGSLKVEYTVPITYYFNAEHGEVGYQWGDRPLHMFDPPRQWHPMFCDRLKAMPFVEPQVLHSSS